MIFKVGPVGTSSSLKGDELLLGTELFSPSEEGFSGSADGSTRSASHPFPGECRQEGIRQWQTWVSTQFREMGVPSSFIQRSWGDWEGFPEDSEEVWMEELGP